MIGEAVAAGPVKESLLPQGRDLGLVESGPEAFEVLRIEAGTPVFGKEITEKNLPQEIGRDARAINFVKGCYLGQETVARLDALATSIRSFAVCSSSRARPVRLPGQLWKMAASASASSRPRRSRRPETHQWRWR